MDGTFFDLRDDDMIPPTTVTGVAEVVMMEEGDLLVSLRQPNVHPDDEQAIVTMAALVDGSMRIRVQSRESDVAEIVIPQDGDPSVASFVYTTLGR